MYLSNDDDCRVILILTGINEIKLRATKRHAWIFLLPLGGGAGRGAGECGLVPSSID